MSTETIKEDTATPGELFEYYQEKVYQLLRYRSRLMILIEFTPDYGVHFYQLQVVPIGDENKQLFYSSGENLWKRYRDAAEFLEKQPKKTGLYDPFPDDKFNH